MLFRMLQLKVAFLKLFKGKKGKSNRARVFDRKMVDTKYNIR